MLDKIEGMQRNVVLSDFTTFHMGGPADYFYELTDVMKVPGLVEACYQNGLPYFLLAWGSNVLFSDKGFRGLVIRNLARGCHPDATVEAVGEPGQPDYRPAGQLIEADSGTLLSQVIQTALKNGLTGMEKLMGIPGTIGGAVRGNAGAFGLEIQSLFEKALVYSPKENQIKKIDHSAMNFTYRHSSLKENRDILLKIALRLIPGDVAAATEEVRQIMTYRAGRHPQGYSAGSFFKNPSLNSIGEGQSAGQLIEACGFKGEKVGGAYISDKHANFLMNDGTATMPDVMELCTRIQEAVWKKFGFHLEREVLLVGEHEYIEDSQGDT